MVTLTSCGTSVLESTGQHTIRLQKEIKLQPDVIAVLSEASLEPRSIGSYSLRIYRVLETRFPYNNYVAGTIELRNGSIKTFKGQDINGDGKKEIIVITESAGTGSYLDASAFEFDGESLNIIASVLDQQPNTDMVQLLIANYQKTSGK